MRITIISNIARVFMYTEVNVLVSGAFLLIKVMLGKYSKIGISLPIM